MTTENSTLPANLTENTGLFGRVLQEFGLQWTNVAILSGVLFSAFGLEKYLNSAVWTISALAAFCFAYLFRHQTSSNFPRVALISGCACIIFLAIPILICLLVKHDVAHFISQFRNASTSYLALATVTPLAFTLSAYRRQAEGLGEGLPESIKLAIAEKITNAPFYKENQRYLIKVTRILGEIVTLRTELSYTLHNRTKEPQPWQGSFTSPAESTRYLRVEVGGKKIDVSDPDYLSSRAIRVTRNIHPGEALAVEFEVEEDFRTRDSELFTTYTPANGMTLTLVNPYPTQLKFYIETLFPEKIDPEVAGEIISCRIAEGVLPYQGFRLHWSPET